MLLSCIIKFNYRHTLRPRLAEQKQIDYLLELGALLEDTENLSERVHLQLNYSQY